MVASIFMYASVANLAAIDYRSVYCHCFSVAIRCIDDLATRFGCHLLNVVILNSPCRKRILCGKYFIQNHAKSFWNNANFSHGSNSSSIVSHCRSSHVDNKAEASATGRHSSFSITLQQMERTDRLSRSTAKKESDVVCSNDMRCRFLFSLFAMLWICRCHFALALKYVIPQGRYKTFLGFY